MITPYMQGSQQEYSGLNALMQYNIHHFEQYKYNGFSISHADTNTTLSNKIYMARHSRSLANLHNFGQQTLHSEDHIYTSYHALWHTPYRLLEFKKYCVSHYT